MTSATPYVVGSIAVAAVLVIAMAANTSLNPFAMFQGADGKPSASQFQFWLWTLTIFFAYIAIYVARTSRGNWDAIDTIPQNVLLATGYSVVTVSGAKIITVAQMSSGSIGKPLTKVATRGRSTGEKAWAVIRDLRWLILDDTGVPSLPKIQMLAWTAIAVVVYLIATQVEVAGIQTADKTLTPAVAGKYGLPDIGAALMVLMGLSQGAYLGLKLGTTTSPKLIGIQKSTIKPGDTITLAGASLQGGGDGSGGQIMVDGQVAPLKPDPSDNWIDSTIQVTLQDQWQGAPTGASKLSIAIAGQSSNALDVVLPARIDNVKFISGARLKPTGPDGLSIIGSGFGVSQSNSRILIDDVDARLIGPPNWTDHKIDSQLIPSQQLAAGDHTISVQIADLKSNDGQVNV